MSKKVVCRCLVVFSGLFHVFSSFDSGSWWFQPAPWYVLRDGKATLLFSSFVKAPHWVPGYQGLDPTATCFEISYKPGPPKVPGFLFGFKVTKPSIQSTRHLPWGSRSVLSLGSIFGVFLEVDDLDEEDFAVCVVGTGCAAR